MRCFTGVILAALVWSCCSAPVFAEKRIALVVGNSAYQNVTRLDNPKSDALLMAGTLGGLGFTLIGGGAQTDLDKTALDLAIQNFGRQIQGADVTLFYYQGVSGHVSPSGAASAVGNANGITVISSDHLSGRSGSGSFRQSDGCVGRWTATKN